MLEFLNNPYFIIGLGGLSVINLIIVGILFLRFRDFGRQHAQLVAGEEVPSIEEIVLKHKKTLASHNKNLKELGEILEELVDKNRLNIQKSGIVRFNPFSEAGGNMSFALALLDGNDSGIVISSLHAREGTRIYGKNITKGQSDSHLTGEEKEAIEQAKIRSTKS